MYNTVFYAMVVLHNGEVEYHWIDTARQSVYDYYDADEIQNVYYLDDEPEDVA